MICEDIIDARNCGHVRCGLSALAEPTVTDLAREFRLRDDATIYKEIDATAASRLIQTILQKDMAYGCRIMSTELSAELAAAFMQQFGSGARYFTNGTYHVQRVQLSPTVWTGPSWDPATEATFDTGVLVIGQAGSGCLWIEDED